MAFGPLYGLLLAVAVSVLGLVYRSSRVEVEVMGRVAEEKAAWGSVRDHPERATVPGILVLRMDTPVFWVTAVPFHDAILAEVDAAGDVKAVVLDMQATHQMDTTSADALGDLLTSLRRRGIDLYLVRVMWAVRKVLRRSGLMAEIGDDHLWHSISQAVRQARRLHGPALAALEVPDAPEDVVEEHIVARNPGAPAPDEA